MKLYKLAYYVLILSFIWISCGGDDTNPQIEIISPQENATLFSSQLLTFEAIVTDNEELDFAVISITGPDDEVMLRKIELEGDSQMISETFELMFVGSGNVYMSVNVVDECENNTLIERFYDYTDVPTGSLNLNIKLQHNGDPLVMFQPFEYPDGRKIDYTRFSFYASDVKLDDETIAEIDFHNLTNSHASLPFANNGYNWQIDFVPVGNYSTLSFNVGVPADLNSKDPGEFPSGHPLAKPAENWFSWMSYIFMKVEGNIDLDGDEEMETGVALHTGSDEALRNISLDIPAEIKSNETTTVNLVIDLYQLFDGPDRIFPIEENPQIHSLSQIDAVNELSDNLTNAIQKF